MNLEWSAITLAGHVCLIVSVLLILRNAVLVRQSISRGLPLLDLSPLIEPLVFFLTALVVERAYYVAARAMVKRGVDLWQAHPSPGVLAAGLGLMALWVAIALLRIAAPDRRAFQKQAAVQVTFVLGLFALLSWSLW